MIDDEVALREAAESAAATTVQALDRIIHMQPVLDVLQRALEDHDEDLVHVAQRALREMRKFLAWDATRLQ